MAGEKALAPGRVVVWVTLVSTGDCGAESVEVGGDSSASVSPRCGSAVDSRPASSSRAHPRADTVRPFGQCDATHKHAPSVRARQPHTSAPRSARRTVAGRGWRRRARGQEWGSPGGTSAQFRTAPRAPPRAGQAGPRVLRRAAGPQSALHARARTLHAMWRAVLRSMRVRPRSTSSATARAVDAAWVELSIIANERPVAK